MVALVMEVAVHCKMTDTVLLLKLLTYALLPVKSKAMPVGFVCTAIGVPTAVSVARSITETLLLPPLGM